MSYFPQKKSNRQLQHPIWPLTIVLLLATDSFASPNPTDTTIQHLVVQAQTALANGQPQQAAELYEKAAGYGESATAEIGLVRAYLQAGEFRKTIAFANLVAAEHADVNDTTALLAYLEDREGQTAPALAKLDEALKNHPDDVALLGAYAEILIDRMAATQAIQRLDAWIAKNPPNGDIYRLRARAALAVGNLQDVAAWRKKAAAAYQASGQAEEAKQLLDWIARLPGAPVTDNANTTPIQPTAADNSRWPAPYFKAFPIVSNAIKSGNGFVIDQGRHIVTFASLVANPTKAIWVRNGLGEIRPAQVEKLSPNHGLALLRMSQPYPKGWSLPKLTLQTPKPLKFCFVFGYPLSDGVEASYPLLVPSVVVRSDVGVGGLMQISSALNQENSGSPVFDPSGQLIGMTLGKQETLPGITDRDGMLGKGFFALRTEELRQLLPKEAQGRAKRGKASKGGKTKTAYPSVEELYEKLQPAVVSIIDAN